MKTLLLLAEHDQHGLKPATLNTLTAAKQLSNNITLLLVGPDSERAATQASAYQGVTNVMINNHACYDHGLAENIAALMADLAQPFTYLLAPATTFGKNILPRVSALLTIAMISDVCEIIDDNTFVQPIYAGNALKTVRNLQAKQVLSIRTSAFTAAGELTSTPAPIDVLTQHPQARACTFINQQLTVSTRPELTSARVIIAGGRALQSADNFDTLLAPLATKLNAAIGASRAAVDAGFAPNDQQVGQTGKIVAPELYIAIGISGAIQHLAGMKDSNVIVAINCDPDAAIFHCADYGLVGDLHQIVPELIEKL